MGLKIYYITYFKNTDNANYFVSYSLAENLIAVFLSFFMVAYLRIGVIGLIWGQLLAATAIFTILSFRFFRLLPVSVDLGALKSSLKLSLPLTLRIFFGVIGNQFDKYMIGLLASVGGSRDLQYWPKGGLCCIHLHDGNSKCICAAGI